MLLNAKLVFNITTNIDKCNFVNCVKTSRHKSQLFHSFKHHLNTTVPALQGAFQQRFHMII